MQSAHECLIQRPRQFALASGVLFLALASCLSAAPDTEPTIIEKFEANRGSAGQTTLSQRAYNRKTGEWVITGCVKREPITADMTSLPPEEIEYGSAQTREGLYAYYKSLGMWTKIKDGFTRSEETKILGGLALSDKAYIGSDLGKVANAKDVHLSGPSVAKALDSIKQIEETPDGVHILKANPGDSGFSDMWFDKNHRLKSLRITSGTQIDKLVTVKFPEHYDFDVYKDPAAIGRLPKEKLFYKVESLIPKPTTGFGFSFGDNNGKLLVRRVIVNGPAFAAGVKPGDEILEINGAKPEISLGAAKILSTIIGQPDVSLQLLAEDGSLKSLKFQPMPLLELVKDGRVEVDQLTNDQ